MQHLYLGDVDDIANQWNEDHRVDFESARIKAGIQFVLFYDDIKKMETAVADDENEALLNINFYEEHKNEKQHENINQQQDIGQQHENINQQQDEIEKCSNKTERCSDEIEDYSDAIQDEPDEIQDDDETKNKIQMMQQLSKCLSLSKTENKQNEIKQINSDEKKNNRCLITRCRKQKHNDSEFCSKHEKNSRKCIYCDRFLTLASFGYEPYRYICNHCFRDMYGQ